MALAGPENEARRIKAEHYPRPSAVSGFLFCSQPETRRQEGGIVEEKV